MIKIVVMAKTYPKDDNNVGDAFVRTRCKHYLAQGDVDLAVVSNTATEDYMLDGINVYTPDSYVNKFSNEEKDVLVIHAPQAYFHKWFLKTTQQRFKKIVYVFHGFEALRIDKVYPKPYEYDKTTFISYLRQRYCDFKRLKSLKAMLKKYVDKSYFVFVSNWMYRQFLKWVNFHPEKSRVNIINNCTGKEFENEFYDERKEKEYDFLAIRSGLDGSKYCVDIICGLAKKYPEYKFCLVGQGDYFKHYEKPQNLDIVYALLTHKEVVDYCNNAKCALMPTRTDAQGVMACEIATLGMPLIVSDIEVMKEIFNGFENVYYVQNDIKKIDLKAVFEEATSKPVGEKNEKYFMENTSLKEIELFKKITKQL